MRVFDKAFVLHTREYRETSAIIQCLSLEHGLISGVVKGVYSSGKRAQQLRGQLQPGNHLDLEWLQKSSNLKSITQIELRDAHSLFDTKPFLCLAYINELLLKLLAENQAAAVLYEAYFQLLNLLKDDGLIEPALRLFEFTLLDYMGLLADLRWDFMRQQLIEADANFALVPHQGVRLALPEDKFIISGQSLQAIAGRQFTDAQVLKDAKQLSRILLRDALGGKPLKSRQLYKDMLS